MYNDVIYHYRMWKKSTIDEIESYLIKKYPKEEFKILNK